MRFRAIFLGLGWAGLCLSFVADRALAARPPQPQEQSGSHGQPGTSQQEEKDAPHPQAKTPHPDADPSTVSHTGWKGLGEDFLLDQKSIWTSPAKLRWSDAQWLLPLGGFASALFVTDPSVSSHLSNDTKTISHYKTISDAGIGAMIGGAGGMWLLGHLKHNSHWTETGFLAGEAAASSLADVEFLKFSLGRARPFQGNGTGSFFQGGTSFPSEHAAAAWSVAGVIAHEYPGPLSKIAAYSLAALIDFSRVRGKQHFPSDVFVGSLAGNLIAQDVYSRRHDPLLGGSEWNSISSSVREFSASPPSIPASPFVPLDSWIYPAIERLVGAGYIDSAFLGSRPWTRMECARLVAEAGEHLGENSSSNSTVEGLYERLSAEFQRDLDSVDNGGENVALVESLYTTSTEIVGTPVNDSYHFGQTIINNFGRPYRQGFNTVDGFSGWAAEGRFVIYVRGEYQHAPSAPGLSQSLQNLIGALDSNPALTASPISATNQFRLLDTYIATTLGGWNASFGKQSLWLGQGEGGALLFSDNAEPVYMFRLARNSPITLPWIFRYLGPVKMDAFIGQLAGNDFPPRPLLHAETISFKPTKNFELVFSRMAEFGGLGRALTPGAFFNSYFSYRESNFYASNDNPGKRTAGFQFSYRLPFLRDWLTLYGDSISPDDVSPVSNIRRAAINPGLYLSHFPKLPKLDLRVEGVSTNTPISSVHGQFLYIDNYYHDLSTNNGNIIGSWIGREGVGYQGWATYWFGPRTSLQLGYRRAKVAPDFIPHGETFNDASSKLSFWIHGDLNIALSTQYEKWFAPVLAPTPQTDWTSTIGVSYQPKGLRLPFHGSHNDQGPNSNSSDAGAKP